MKLSYTVMGTHPGDGGVYTAESPDEALAMHLRQDIPEISLELATERVTRHGHGDYVVQYANEAQQLSVIAS
jgi:hypothetical protein